jgi:hypothetical protein
MIIDNRFLKINLAKKQENLYFPIVLSKLSFLQFIILTEICSTNNKQLFRKCTKNFESGWVGFGWMKNQFFPDCVKI